MKSRLSSLAYMVVLAVAVPVLFFLLSATTPKTLPSAMRASRHAGDPTAVFVTDCGAARGSNAIAKHSGLWGSDTEHMNGSARASVAVAVLKHKQILADPSSSPSSSSSSVDPTRIVDIGAGFQAIRTLLPAGVDYVPVDFEERVPGSGTVLCNLNELSFPLMGDSHVSVFLFLGSFEYVLDKVAALRLCRSKGAPVFLQYQMASMFDGREHQWVTPLTVRSFSEAATLAGYKAQVFRTLGDLVDGVEVPRSHSGNSYVYLEPV